MCGIFLYYSNGDIDGETYNTLVQYGNSIRHRGPDKTEYLSLNDNKLLFGFHRLAINDLTVHGDQPMVLDQKYYLICNGEIYNHILLEKKYGFKTMGHSDCEIILHMYREFGIERTLKEISGYFAFSLWDDENKKLYIARDPIGVRQLYIGKSGDRLCVCSEMKGIPPEFRVEQFKPGTYYCNGEYTLYHTEREGYKVSKESETSLELELVKIRELFENAVKKRFMTDRPFGVFLSGGLDSSLVASLVGKYSGDKRIHTFSIGMNESTDIINARVVAKHINSIHHEVIVTPEQMLEAIPEVVRQIETWDTTTIRASTPMYLLSKYIKENTDIVVVFSGEGSDEASGGYLYFHNAPSDEEFHKECERLLADLSYFDCLRCDKSTAGNGLEVRVPFLDKEFLSEYMKVPTVWKRPKDGMEKWFIRKAFDDGKLLPSSILWRKKEAFSDGVSTVEKSWFTIIGEHVDSMISDNRIETYRKENGNPLFTKENLYYLDLFNKYYSGRGDTIPYYWLPRWSGGATDPSARTLQVYR